VENYSNEDHLLHEPQAVFLRMTSEYALFISRDAGFEFVLVQGLMRGNRVPDHLISIQKEGAAMNKMVAASASSKLDGREIAIY